MLADSFHAATEKKISDRWRIFSLDEFSQVVSSTNQHSAVIKPLWSDFKALKGHDTPRTAGWPQLPGICAVQFRRGTITPFVKVKFTDDWQAFDYQDQQVKINPVKLNEVPALQNGNRGLRVQPNPDIIHGIVIEKIDHGVHAHIAKIYKDITVKNNVADLSHGDDPDPAVADV